MAVTDTLNNAWSYVVGQCTAFVAGVLSWVPAGLGNAKEWYANAQTKGLPTGQTPQVGSVAVWGTAVSPFGHVAEVTGLVPGGFIVQEQNFSGGPGVVDTRTVTGNALHGLLGFIYPPGGAGSSPLANVPVVGGVADAAASLGSIGPAIAGAPAQVGHGLADALTAMLHNLRSFAQNQAVALIVALAVAVVLFAAH